MGFIDFIHRFEMKFYTYVLHSKSFNKIYIGQSSDLLTTQLVEEKRLEEHNLGLSTYTKRYIPWEIIYIEEYQTWSEAMKREKELKSQKGREFIWKIIDSRVRLRRLTDDGLTAGL